MIFLDWLLRFHPIIIILLQGPATWTPEAWLRRKLWLCLSVSVSQWLSLSWLQVPWSPGHMPQALSCLWATVMSPVHQTANTEGKCLGIPAHETISWVILQTSHWYARRPQTGNWTVLRSRSENAGCLMSDGGRLESAVTSPRSIWLSVTSSPVSSSAWCLTVSRLTMLTIILGSSGDSHSQSSAGRNKFWSVSDIQDWISIFY